MNEELNEILKSSIESSMKRIEYNGNNYLKNIKMEYNEYIDMNKEKMSGMPCIKNTRIPVSLIISCLKDNLSIEQIKQDYKLSNEQIIKSLEFVETLLDKPYL